MQIDQTYEETYAEFKEWFELQKEKGMTAFHWTLNPEATINAQQWMRSILDAEKAIAEGRYTVIGPLDDN